MSNAPSPTAPPAASDPDPLAFRARVFEIAAKTGADPRTIARALREGPDVVHGLALRERVRAAMRETEGR